MLSEHDQKAADVLAHMSDAERRNAARLGFVTLGIKPVPPSFASDTIDITPEILAEEARIRARLVQHCG